MRFDYQRFENDRGIPDEPEKVPTFKTSYPGYQTKISELQKYFTDLNDSNSS